MLPRLKSIVRYWVSVTAGVGLAVSALAGTHVGWSFDSGTDPLGADAFLDGALNQRAPVGSWLRIRGLAVPTGPSARTQIQQVRDALSRLREHGYRLVGHLRWDPSSWPGGTRVNGAPCRLPIDLREPFERCRALAATYGDLVDYWEIDNEPDISFVQENPETYAAYLKACDLGVAEGNAERETRNAKSEPAAGAAPAGDSISACQRVSVSVFPARAASRVLMAPLALPPGPYFEAFVRNGGLSYTDGFNYHFYGYAEDFTGVYEQFHAAVAAACGPATRNQGPQPQRETRNAESGNESDMQRRGNPSAFRVSPSAFPISLFHTEFLPNATGWEGTQVDAFNAGPAQTDANRELLLKRPLAHEEPPLHPLGRWLVSDGVKVQEFGNVWRFTITHWPAGPLRAPVAELPLAEVGPGIENRGPRTQDQGPGTGSAGTSPDQKQASRAKPPIGAGPQKATLRESAWRSALLSFEYRSVEEPGVKTISAVDAISPEKQHAEPARRALNREIIQDAEKSVVAQKVTKETKHSIASAESAFANSVNFCSKGSDSNQSDTQKDTKSTKAQSTLQEQAETAESQACTRPGSTFANSVAFCSNRSGSNQPCSQKGAKATKSESLSACQRVSVSACSDSASSASSPQVSGFRSQVSAFRVSRSAFPARQLPVFLTEYGYGSLDKVTRNTADGRERQRAFFAQTGEQIRHLGIEGAMAFVLMPYLEQNIQEFGLLSNTPIPQTGVTTKHAQDTREEQAGSQKVTKTTKDPSAVRAPRSASLPQAQVSGFSSQVSQSSLPSVQTGSEIGHKEAQKGAKTDPSSQEGAEDTKINCRAQVSGFRSQVSNQKLGPYYITPALAEIMRDGNTPLKPRRWTVATPPRSPVVIDFIAGRGLREMKTYCGYVLEGDAGRTVPGEGNLVVYNFSDREITGELTLTGEAWRFDVKRGTRNAERERAELRDPSSHEKSRALCFRVSRSEFRVPATPSWPSRSSVQKNQCVFLRLRPMDRLLIPVRVWTHVDEFVASDAGAEFRPDPIPPGIEPFEQKVTEVTKKEPEEQQPKSLKPKAPPAPAPAYEVFEPYFRTANGNLYGTWPRLAAVSWWQHYVDATANFSMAFWGRANLPWRFEENRPVSLVFIFHPDHFPAVYEVRDAQLEAFRKAKV